MDIDFDKLEKVTSQASENIDCLDCKKLLKTLENSLLKGEEKLNSVLEELSKHLGEVDHEALSTEEEESNEM